jgi:hypothetical protein
MATGSSLALQKALHAALIADAGLAAIVAGRVHDDVPQGAVFPYVVIGDVSTRDWSTQTEDGHEHIVVIHAWSRQRGRREVQMIIERIDAVLDGALLTLEDHRLVTLRVVFWTALRDLDGASYHGVVRLRAVTEPL